MKTYEPRRNNECPNGIHATYDPALDPTQNECTCPWLVIASSTPVQHLTSWSRRELENVIRETDRGYFDPPGYPLRSNSMFLSPNMQRLVDIAEKEPVAAALTLLAGAAAHGDSGLPPFDAIAWDAEDACLSIRVGNAGGWRRLHLGHTNVDAVTDHDTSTPGGANPTLLWADHADTYAEIEFRRLFPEEHDPEPAQDYFAEDITGTALPIFAADVSPNPDNGEGFAVAYTSPPDLPLLVVPPAVANLAALVETGNPVYDQASAAVESLPRRVPQVPSAIAEAATDAGKPCTLRCTASVNVTFTDDDRTESYFRCEKNSGHDGDHFGSGSTWPDPATHLTGVAPTRAVCIRCGFVPLEQVDLLVWNSPHGEETHTGCGGSVTMYTMDDPN